MTGAAPRLSAEAIVQAAQIYRIYFHGPAYQVLERAWWDGTRMIGEMAAGLPGNHQPSDRPTLMAPRLIELCFQTAGLWEMGAHSRMGLPQHVHEVSWLRAPQSAEGRLYAVVTPHPEQGSFDAEVVDATGNRYVRLGGYSTAALPDGLDAESLKALHIAHVAGSRHRLMNLLDCVRWLKGDLCSTNFNESPSSIAAKPRCVSSMRPASSIRSTAHRCAPSRSSPILTAMPCSFARPTRRCRSAPPQIVDPTTNHLKSSYVDYARPGARLDGIARAEAVWVGWGFVAEHAQFADLCRDMGIVFIGPDGDVMRRLGDKISSKRLAEQAQIPIAPWSGGPVETLDDAWHHAERLGYPLFIKATAGGGGHGIRRVHLGQ